MPNSSVFAHIDSIQVETVHIRNTEILKEIIGSQIRVSSVQL